MFGASHCGQSHSIQCFRLYPSFSAALLILSQFSISKQQTNKQNATGIQHLCLYLLLLFSPLLCPKTSHTSPISSKFTTCSKSRGSFHKIRCFITLSPSIRACAVVHYCEVQRIKINLYISQNGPLTSSTADSKTFDRKPVGTVKTK